MQFRLVADSIRNHTRLDTFLEHFTVTARVPRERREPIACPWLIDAVRAVAAKLKWRFGRRAAEDHFPLFRKAANRGSAFDQRDDKAPRLSAGHSRTPVRRQVPFQPSKA
jgi:hypothetical protein